MEGYARRIAVAGTKAVPRMQQHTPPPPKKSPGSATQRCRGKPHSKRSLPRINSGLPYSPSSYTTLPAQMVNFTFP